jgi:hypothetical protein
MTVPSVPNRSLEHLEREALPFQAFPLPMGGNVGNACHLLSRVLATFSQPSPVKRN